MHKNSLQNAGNSFKISLGSMPSDPLDPGACCPGNAQNAGNSFKISLGSMPPDPLDRGSRAKRHESAPQNFPKFKSAPQNF